jgi:hypothetical protein
MGNEFEFAFGPFRYARGGIECQSIETFIIVAESCSSPRRLVDAFVVSTS